METKAERGKDDIHVIVFPFPIEGHINPMLQFSRQLVSRGLRVTLVTTSPFATKFTPLDSNSITIETISDGTTEVASAKSTDAYITRFNEVAPHSLTQLTEKKLQVKDHVKCLIYDSTIPWGLDVARKFGMYGVPFFTHSCLVSLVFHQVYHGVLSTPIEEETNMCVGGMPLIEARDVPSLVRKVGVFPVLEKLVLDQFSNCGDADWVCVSPLPPWISSTLMISTIHNKNIIVIAFF
ncbi:hypothetical protein Cgig2_018971 [Carnegiea gigantea]|uniref:Glycosyltransferase N-terminal domain-containing protein n=1 Tax=Carnegiea gigantea TaxID=171969 RepID=A0A9Q1K1N8_9CARY|nr:hypothetical protein Cgig2_018971 [Carnegiea gigantea]